MKPIRCAVRAWRRRFEDQGRSRFAGDSPQCRCRYLRHRAPVVHPQFARVVLALAAISLLLCGVIAQPAQPVNCCSGPDAQVDCLEAGVIHQGERYYCMNLEPPQNRACVSCIPATSSTLKCSQCCGIPNAECDLEWSWGAVLATLSVSAVFATCSGILALAEKRRKRKGISLARAWSIPHGMPVLRATVVDLSDAVRGRAPSWNVDGFNGEDLSSENVGLLEELPNDSIYGALVEQHEADMPVAKLAEDNWVTAMAFASGVANRDIDPVTYGRGEAGDEESWSVSRWRSARATARQARRLNSSSGSMSGIATAANATAVYRNTPAAPSPSGRGEMGDGGNGWERPLSLVGNDSERLEEQQGPR